jgi:hypothetical protein
MSVELGIVGGEISDFGKSTGQVTERGGREKRGVEGKREGRKRKRREKGGGEEMEEGMGIKMGVLGVSV